MFLGVLLNAVVIGSFTSALSSMDSKKELCRGKLETINSYLIHNVVPSTLRNSIVEYYEYLFVSQSMEELNLLRELPPTLASQLAITVHRQIVKRCPFFVELSSAALITLLSKLRPVIYAPTQVVIIQDQPLRFISFINKGTIELISKMGHKEEHVARTLSQFDNFGTECLQEQKGERIVSLTERAEFSARAKTYSDVMKLTTSDLSRILARDSARTRAANAKVLANTLSFWKPAKGPKGKWGAAAGVVGAGGKKPPPMLRILTSRNLPTADPPAAGGAEPAGKKFAPSQAGPSSPPPHRCASRQTCQARSHRLRVRRSLLLRRLRQLHRRRRLCPHHHCPCRHFPRRQRYVVQPPARRRPATRSSTVCVAGGAPALGERAPKATVTRAHS